MISISLFGLTSILCFGLPVFAIVLFKLYRHTSLIALAVYYLLTIVHCLYADKIPPVPNFVNKLDRAYSYVEIPLMLTSLLFFCHARQRQQIMQKIIMAFMCYELLIAAYFKFSAEGTMYIVAPGLLVVLGYTMFLLLRQLKFTIMHGKNIGRVFMLAAILFSYSAYALVFYTYFIQKQPEINGLYSLYFISSTVASILMAIGLYLMRHRIKELQELKVVRKELQMVFGS
ncbi:MAG: hypothetical protein EOO10_15550 [Chitinophagaceae bacterium]|nr:MAG: hypothetical protein EOO10_15550 [Chitinophagaceae bacterium]